MKAIAVDDFNQEPYLMDLPDPKPGPGEILVAVDAASINPINWKEAQGAFRGMMDTEFPLVLRREGSARVGAFGPGADRYPLGSLVHGKFWVDFLGRGTF